MCRSCTTFGQVQETQATVRMVISYVGDSLQVLMCHPTPAVTAHLGLGRQAAAGAADVGGQRLDPNGRAGGIRAGTRGSIVTRHALRTAAVVASIHRHTQADLLAHVMTLSTRPCRQQRVDTTKTCTAPYSDLDAGICCVQTHGGTAGLGCFNLLVEGGANGVDGTRAVLAAELNL